VISGGQPIVLKTGMLADLDPETGKPVSMNLMSDAREATLKTQALSAIMGHEQARVAPSREQIEKIVEFESQVYAAQAAHIFGGPLAVPEGPRSLGVAALRDHKAGVLGDNREDRAIQFVEGNRLLPRVCCPRCGPLYVSPVLAARYCAHQLHWIGESAETHLRHLSQLADDRAGSLGRMG
jgi:hypothetical protein